MPHKHENTERIGGPGASHENRKEPEKTKPRGPHPSARGKEGHSQVSTGGGELDVHREHTAAGKAGGKADKAGKGA
ncbi:MAG TPA: hypothetical protein VHL31_16165 [Geminicoccus sp.]|jgi:hypothetical protein|uniref:hypothetical protein n=1 Tax=Geminicoccus sp. TaxID=2024832 RepID=UPI002E2EF43C|nr:hypothetical protein [Geminicoccus sp.]HEX2527819.1 hypothetical protein [Geminicoccus sp.]